MGIYRRWRHTRGFGVHSPFAYRLVTEAIRPARGYVYHAELLPGMTPLRRMAFRLRTLLLSSGYPELIYSYERWLTSPSLPLFLEAPSKDCTDEIRRRLQESGCGILLHSPRFLFAMQRPQMAFVSYSLL